MTTTRIQVRRGTAASWTSANPILSAGEPGFETDTGKFKIGDGSTAWTSLDYMTSYHGAKGTRSTNQAITTGGAGTAVTFPTETEDTDGLFTAGGSLFTVPWAGRWLVCCFVQFDGQTGGTYREAWLEINSAFSAGYPDDPRPVNGTVPVSANLSQEFNLAASATVRAMVLHDRGSDLNIVAASMSVSFLGF